MISERLFHHRPLATKIALLVALMGAISLAVMGYALNSMLSVDQNYRSLIESEMRLATHLGDAAATLSETRRTVHTAVFDQDATRRQSAAHQVRTMQRAFMAQLDAVTQMQPASASDIGLLAAKASALFNEATQATEAVDIHSEGQAQRIVRERFEPALRALSDDVGALRQRYMNRFEASVASTNAATDRTLWTTTLAVTLGLAMVIALSAYVAVSQISRPVAHLTRIMERLTARDYAEAIPGTQRRDEVGTMARALQVFKDSMQRADQLAAEVVASAEARRLSEQLVDLTGAIPGAVFQMQLRTDGWCQFLFVSDKAAHLPGVPAKALRRTEGPIEEAYGANDALKTCVREAFTTSMHTLGPVDFDVQVDDGPDGPRWLRTLATARPLPDGGAMFNGVWLDVTDRKREAQALREAKDTAEQAASDRAQFLAVMSHEIRTPLNAILGLSQLALKEPLNTAQQERVEQMQRSSKHLLGIVNDILDFSKMDGGHLQLEKRAFALQHVLSDVMDMLAPKALRKGLALQVHIDDEVPDHLMGDPQRIAQILINYVQNAIKFTAKGEVVVALRIDSEDAQGLVLHGEVRDTGMGLTESQMAQLFQPFHQSDTSITRRFGGTGLGLVISRQLAELMEGSAGVHSTPGEGSTFWFTARVQRAPEPLAMPTDESGPPQLALVPSIPLVQRVLVVDDNPLNLQVACGLLAYAGITADSAADGAQAMEQLANAPPDTYTAVLMDMQMPVMDGLSATRALRALPQWRDLPIVAMTANATHADIEAAYAAGVNAYLAKPLLEDVLWRTLAPWLQPAHPTSPIAAKAQPSPAPTPQPLPNAPLQRAPFDARILEELLVLFDPPSLRTLLAHFIRNCERRMSVIQSAVHREDWATTYREAHALGGSVGSFGLLRLNDVAQALENAARAREPQAVVQQYQALTAAAEEGLMQLRAMQTLLGGPPTPGEPPRS
ncbi:MAG: ATP-binding protein [Acidovorax sp.]|uniref:ATP-binding protein n=1 Tax=Acidovorax sp. TaxID=1872122 RepID=UPI00391BDCFB